VTVVFCTPTEEIFCSEIRVIALDGVLGSVLKPVNDDPYIISSNNKM